MSDISSDFPESLPPNWARKDHVGGDPSRPYLERSDGAYVWYSDQSPHPNPADPQCRMWTAYGADGRYLGKKSRGRSLMVVPRRWKTPEAAMKALDREQPLGEVGHSESSGAG